MRIGRRAALTGLGLLGARAGAQEMHSGAIPVVPVRLQTALGSIEMILYIKKAPRSCEDFLKYIDAGSYDKGAFTRVVRPDNDHGSPKIDVIQGGIGQGAKVWAPVPLEPTNVTGLTHRDGTVSLPRDGVGTGSGSEFFICIGDQPSLDFGGTRNKDGQGFAAFGQIVAGMALVRRIWGMNATGPSPDAYTAGQMLLHPVALTAARRG